MNRVMIDMENKNSLISLAYIETCDNPLQVFCNFIIYLLLKAPDQAIRADVLKEKLYDKFGISMPQQIINNCIRIMEKRNEVVRLPYGAGYQVKSTSFDIDLFENTQVNLHAHEDMLLQSLVAFVNTQYKKKWDKESARSFLSDFLDKEGYGAQLFLKNKLDLDHDYVSPSLYIGRYINYIQQQTESVEKDYLEEVVHGMMVLQGLRQTEDYQQNISQKFRGTVFYFDTKLVLRALGFSWKAQVDSAQEMVRLLREKYEAEIGVFYQTVVEVRRALSVAGQAYKSKKKIYDVELELYCQLHPDEASLLEAYADNLEAILKRDLKIESITSVNRNEELLRKYNTDVKGIADYIEDRCGWRRGSIEYDVEIINQVNILRKGDYSQAYGGKSKLPVFVTSNSKLAYTFRDYTLSDANVNHRWNSHALPVISDNMLLYRIWLPFATEFTKLPSLTLSRFAYAAQNEGVVFYEKLRVAASKLESTKNIDLISVSEVTRRKIEDILLRETDGNINSVTDEVVATSIEEYVSMEKNNLLKENKSLTDLATSRERQVIELLASDYVNKLGIGNRVILLLAKYWWIIAAGVLYTIVGQISDALLVKGAAAIIAPICNLVIVFIDKTADDKGVRHAIYPKALEFVKKRYSNKIRAALKYSDYESDTDMVIDYCIRSTKIFKT